MQQTYTTHLPHPFSPASSIGFNLAQPCHTAASHLSQLIMCTLPPVTVAQEILTFEDHWIWNTNHVTLLCSCFVSNLGWHTSGKQKLMHKPSKIRRWDVLRTLQYPEERTFQGQWLTFIIEPPMITLLKKWKEAQIPQNISKKHVFGSTMMMMSCLRMLNKMSAVTHHQLLFLTVRKRLISTHLTHFTSAWYFLKD